MKQTIALVDDDRNILTSVSMTLEQEGFTVRTYTDGESALQGLTARPRRRNRHRQVFLHLRLADKLLQPLRTQLQLEPFFALQRPTGHQTRTLFLISSHTRDVISPAAKRQLSSQLLISVPDFGS